MKMNSSKTTVIPNPSETYRTEIGEALTEFLFGEEENLDPIKFDDPRVEYYVLKRKPRSGEDSVRDFNAEKQLFENFWPPNNYPQVLHLIGGQGSGKSTFTRYFFQYFLPYYERLVNSLDPNSELCKIHSEALRRHILLYVDLRFAPAMDFRPYVFKKLGASLNYATKRLGCSNTFEGKLEYTEDWVMHNISQLAEETEHEERKWNVSWIFDNSDQLGKDQLIELMNIVFGQIPREQSSAFPTDPVQDGQGRELWRVIIPLRPETWTNLESNWAPFHNRDRLELDPIDHNALMKKRADFIFQNVGQSKKHYQPEPKRITKDRADWDLKTPEEMATALQKDMQDASILEGNMLLTSEEARSVLDQLAGDSSRRRMSLCRQVAFSRSFGARKARGRRAGWTKPIVTPFYYFDGLICGNRRVHDPNRSPVLNLYNLGATQTSGAPYSIFVGLHAISLLIRGRQWTKVKTDLAKIGYPDNDLNECEQNLLNKELIKELWHGGHQIESSMICGHWELLKERAYTDNMAVACARSWGFGKDVPKTDPLDPQQLPRRFEASLWFLKKVWDAEQSLTVYSPDALPDFENLGQFSDFRNTLDLPSVTHYVTSEYLDKVQKLRDYERPRIAIQSDREQWQKNLEELNNLVEESKDEHALDAHQS